MVTTKSITERKFLKEMNFHGLSYPVTKTDAAGVAVDQETRVQ